MIHKVRQKKRIDLQAIISETQNSACKLLKDVKARDTDDTTDWKMVESCWLTYIDRKITQEIGLDSEKIDLDKFREITAETRNRLIAEWPAHMQHEADIFATAIDTKIEAAIKPYQRQASYQHV